MSLLHTQQKKRQTHRGETKSLRHPRPPPRTKQRVNSSAVSDGAAAGTGCCAHNAGENEDKENTTTGTPRVRTDSAAVPVPVSVSGGRWSSAARGPSNCRDGRNQERRERRSKTQAQCVRLLRTLAAETNGLERRGHGSVARRLQGSRRGCTGRACSGINKGRTGRER